MARGRKPDGPDLQAAKGNPGRRKPAAPKAKAAALKSGEAAPPAWLKKSARGMAVWRQIVPMLARLNLASELDAIPLGRYCRYVAEWIVADEAIRQEGTWFDAVDTNGHATKRLHPAFKAAQSLERVLADMESSYGMRADARFKILRDQAATVGGMPLFDRGDTPQEKATEATGDDDGGDDLVGALSRMDSLPPGARPN